MLLLAEQETYYKLYKLSVYDIQKTNLHSDH